MRLSLSLSTLTVLSSILFSAPAWPSNFHVKQDHRFGEKQYAYSQVWLDEAGNGKLYSKYSNCHTIDGDTYVTLAQLRDANNNVLGVVEIRAGMSVNIGPGCNVRELDKHFKVPADKLARVKSIAIGHREIDTRDDTQIARAIFEIIRKAIEQPPEPEDQNVHWKPEN